MVGWPGPGQTGGREGDQGNHESYLPFIGRVSGYVWLYREMGRGVRAYRQRQGNCTRSPRGRVAVFYHDTPLPPTQVDRAEHSNAVMPDRQSGETRQASAIIQAGSVQVVGRPVKVQCH